VYNKVGKREYKRPEVLDEGAVLEDGDGEQKKTGVLNMLGVMEGLEEGPEEGPLAGELDAIEEVGKQSNVNDGKV
jgi:hypothetical protein